jgi:beta-lactamase class A
MYYYLAKRLLLVAAIVIAFISAYPPSFANSNPSTAVKTSMQEKLAALEISSGGRLGIYAINRANNQVILYRANERFPFCSTFKLMVAGAILHKSMAQPDLLQQKVTYNKKDLVVYSPATEKHVKEGMTVAQLCKAAMTLSDNTAANLLMKKSGGPQAINHFARTMGDNKFRLVRWEPELNSAIPGDLRDTTTPAAMARSLEKLALGKVLSPAQRQQLQAWLKANTTGNARIRAGVPAGWIVGDKTGTCGYGTTSDIGIIWPPNQAPIVVAIYLSQNNKNAKPRDDVIASASRLLVSGLVSQ